MPFENNGTSQKWHMTNTPHKIGKYNTCKKWLIKKMAHYAEKGQKVICQERSWVILKRKFLSLLYQSDPCWWNVEIEFFHLLSNFRGKFC